MGCHQHHHVVEVVVVVEVGQIAGVELVVKVGRVWAVERCQMDWCWIVAVVVVVGQLVRMGQRLVRQWVMGYEQGLMVRFVVEAEVVVVVGLSG